MTFSVAVADERVRAVEFNGDAMSVSLCDGRVISVPLVWYPRLLGATPAQRKNWKIAGAGHGIHWPEVDEDLSTEGLLRGAAAPRVHGAQGIGLGRIDIVSLSGGPAWLPLGPARPVQPSALDAASIDAFEQTA